MMGVTRAMTRLAADAAPPVSLVPEADARTSSSLPNGVNIEINEPGHRASPAQTCAEDVGGYHSYDDDDEPYATVIPPARSVAACRGG